MANKRKTALLRGAIDSLEGDWAIVVLDDGQRLDWPCERLPDDARPGMVVTLQVQTARHSMAGEMDAQQTVGTWEGVVGIQEQAEQGGVVIQLGDQSLRWPEIGSLSAGQSLTIQLRADAGDTKRRRRQVQSLVDDLFG